MLKVYCLLESSNSFTNCAPKLLIDDPPSPVPGRLIIAAGEISELISLISKVSLTQMHHTAEWIPLSPEQPICSCFCFYFSRRNIDLVTWKCASKPPTGWCLCKPQLLPTPSRLSPEEYDRNTFKSRDDLLNTFTDHRCVGSKNNLSSIFLCEFILQPSGVES